jgi:hypothetical protein
VSGWPPSSSKKNIVSPKEDVQNVFEDVNRAVQDMNRFINEGKEQYNQEIPKTQGQAKQVIQQAEGYAAERVNRAQGDVARFLAVLQEYEKDKVVTKDCLYIEIVESVSGKAQGTPFLLNVRGNAGEKAAWGKLEGWFHTEFHIVECRPKIDLGDRSTTRTLQSRRRGPQTEERTVLLAERSAPT